MKKLQNNKRTNQGDNITITRLHRPNVSTSIKHGKVNGVRKSGTYDHTPRSPSVSPST